jgi:hypothetical protein
MIVIVFTIVIIRGMKVNAGHYSEDEVDNWEWLVYMYIYVADPEFFEINHDHECAYMRMRMRKASRYISRARIYIHVFIANA